MFPLWIWTAVGGLGLGMIYAAWANKQVRKRPVKPLSGRTVDEITGLIDARKHVRAVKTLRAHTGITLLDAKNRIDDWRPDEEHEAAV